MLGKLVSQHDSYAGGIERGTQDAEGSIGHITNNTDGVSLQCISGVLTHLLRNGSNLPASFGLQRSRRLPDGLVIRRSHSQRCPNDSSVGVREAVFSTQAVEHLVPCFPVGHGHVEAVLTGEVAQADSGRGHHLRRGNSQLRVQ